MDTSLLRRLREAAALLAAELRNADSLGFDLRAILLRNKTIHQLDQGEGPAPQGLSDAYILLAAARNAQARRIKPGAEANLAGPFLRMLTDALHEDIATALLLERQLLHLAGG